MRPPSKPLVKVEPPLMDKWIKGLLTKKLSWNRCRKDVKKRRKKSKSKTEVSAPILPSSISRWIRGSQDKTRICLTPVWPQLHKSAFRRCILMVWLASQIQRPKRLSSFPKSKLRRVQTTFQLNKRRWLWRTCLRCSRVTLDSRTNLLCISYKTEFNDQILLKRPSHFNSN